MAKRPELMVMTGDLSGRRFEVPEAGLRLGRSSSNDLQVTDEELSRNHCIFECDGPDGIRVMDLASANGTFVNGEQLGADARKLKPGDVVEVGQTVLKVSGESASGAVDLGLGATSATTAASLFPKGKSAPQSRRSPLANALWAVVAGVVAAATVVVLVFPNKRSQDDVAVSVSKERRNPEVSSLVYEKVEADAARIFRYYMTLDEYGVLKVVYDDVPDANRHVDKSAKLSDGAKARISEILDAKEWEGLDEAYSGSSAMDENALKSWRIRVVRNGRVKEVLVENTQEPDAFKEIREALEAFSRNELGIWAIQYSREKLIELSEESARNGDAKWNERDVEYGNLSASVDAYREAAYYLDTVNPKPEGYARLKERLERSVAELDRRYREQRFLADKAINLSDWETAKAELRVLCDMVPNKNDDRHAEANAKLVDVENRIKKAKKGGR
jgi:hypothetical protein